MWCDSEVLADVVAALTPVRHADDGWLGVRVRDGRVELAGFVTSLAQRARAVRAVQRVIGVSSVAESIVVIFPELSRRLDAHLRPEEVRLHAGFVPGHRPPARAAAMHERAARR